MLSLYIAGYEARQGNYRHWALCLEKPDKEFTIFEVSEQSPNFSKQMRIDDPEASVGHIVNIPVGSIRDEEVAEVEKAYGSVHVDNETTKWCCQDFVLEILEELREQMVIDNDDEDYETGVQEAKDEHLGPM